MDQLAMEEERIQKQEPELFVKFVAEISDCHSVLGTHLSIADKIAYAITHITAMYAKVIKNARGGWTCGTHANNVCTALSHSISSKYSNEELLRFIDFCVCCNEGRDSLQKAEKYIKDMVEDFLAKRPEPSVHPPLSWWRQVMAEEN